MIGIGSLWTSLTCMGDIVAKRERFRTWDVYKGCVTLSVFVPDYVYITNSLSWKPQWCLNPMAVHPGLFTLTHFVTADTDHSKLRGGRETLLTIVTFELNHCNCHSLYSHRRMPLAGRDESSEHVGAWLFRYITFWQGPPDIAL
jgi:hypothetical protein